MDDPADEEDDYLDDDLDALPDHAFHQLQQNAIQSTQQPSLSAQVQLPTVKQPTERPSGIGPLSVAGSASRDANQSPFLAPSSDYGDFDDEMLDGEIFDAAEEPALASKYKAGPRGREPGEHSQREHWRLQRYGPNEHNSTPTETLQRVSQQGAAGVPFQNGNGLGNPNATVREGRGINLVDESQTRPPPQEMTDVLALQAQVKKVGLLKARFNRVACLYFYSATK